MPIGYGYLFMATSHIRRYIMQRFESKDFTESLLTQNKNGISLILALLVNTNMFNLLFSTLKDKFTKSNGSFLEKITQDAEAYASWSEEEITIQIIFTLNKILGIPPIYYFTKRDINDNGEQICNRTVPVLKAIDSEFKGATFDDFIRYQLMNLFKQSFDQDQIDNLSGEEYDQFLNSLETFIDSLPTEQQEKLKKEIGIDELTQEAIHNSIIKGSFGIGFASVVGIGGFPIYMAAASLISSIFGVIGITLPFAFYTGMSSCIAVFANPLFLIPALGLGGFLFFKKGREKLNRMLALVVITQITMANYIDEEKKVTNKGEALLAYWKNIVNSYNNLKKQLDLVNQNLNIAQNYDNELQKSYQLKSKQKNELQNSLLNNHSSFKKLIADMAPNELAVNCFDNLIYTKIAVIVELKKQLNAKQQQLLNSQTAYKNNPNNDGLLSDYQTDKKKCFALQQSINNEISVLVIETEQNAHVLIKSPIKGFLKEYLDSYLNLSKQQNEVLYQINQLNLDLKKSREKIAELRNIAKHIEEQITALNEQYYGIDQIHHFQEESEL